MDNVSFFFSEQITKGALWRDFIKNEIASSDHLLLIYTNPSEDWSWCLYEIVLFDEIVSRADPDKHRIYCLHFSDSSLPDALQQFQGISSRADDIQVWLANLYQATNQVLAFGSIELTAFNIAQRLDMVAPKINKTSNLRPLIKVFPAWFDDKPRWGDLKAIAKKLPLQNSSVSTDSVSASQLGFGYAPDSMNIIDFLKRLDTEDSQSERLWIPRFLELMQIALEGRIMEQNIVLFRSISGSILRPIVESITRSVDGQECYCTVVFVDAYSAPPIKQPSQLQLLANALRLGVRIRLELLNKYKGQLAAEHKRVTSSTDPANELIKAYPLGGRVCEILRTIVLEATIQGYNPNLPPPHIFEDADEQSKYATTRDKFMLLMEQLKASSAKEDQDPDTEYNVSESILNEMDVLNKEFMEIAGPQFVKLVRRS